VLIKYYWTSFLILISTIPLVSSADTITSLQEKAIQQQLWDQPEWLRLLHYYKNSASVHGYVSHVDDRRFFNAGDGAENPRAEMLATLAAFYRTDVKDDQHALCRFVARLDWFKQKLTLDENSLPKVVCKEYIEWHSMIKADSATLIFPTYHLNSPSSMFGHTLLRLDPEQGSSTSKSKWLSFAVNFGADTATGDDSLSYAFKGLSGGYPGIFIVTPYFKKIQEYNKIEKRDIWEYKLNLTPAEVQRMVTHLWELKEINFDYYFFDENCSYRLLELLEVARPGLRLTDEFGLTAIPVDTVKAIEAAGMITTSDYRPSKETELRALLSQLTTDELNLIKQLTTEPSIATDTAFKGLDQKKQQLIIDTAYRYQRYSQAAKSRDKKAAKISHELLALINSYPPTQIIPTITPPQRPEKGHDSRRLSLKFGQDQKQNYAELGFRMAFHSLEDNEKGFLHGAQINMANIQIRANQETNKIKLERLDVIDIFSLTPRTQFFKPLSWRVYTGLEQQAHNSKDSLSTHVTGGGGVTYPLFNDGLFYTLGIMRLENNKQLSNHLIEPAAGIESGVLWHFGSSTARLEISGRKFANGVERSKLHYGHNFSLARNHAIKIDASREKNPAEMLSNASISYQYHF